MNAPHLLNAIFALRLKLDRADPEHRCSIYAELDLVMKQLCLVAKIDETRIRRLLDFRYKDWARIQLSESVELELPFPTSQETTK